MADRDDTKGGITRRDLFKGLGGGALVSTLLPAEALIKSAIAAVPAIAGAATVGPDAVTVQLKVNGVPRTLSVEPRVTLLSALRDRLDLTGAKPACDRGACGACTVLLDGDAINACMMLALDAEGAEITTIEGLAHGDELSPLQASFVEHDALQCGFCTPGMVMSCHGLLAKNPHPTLEQIKGAVAGNLCRCGTYPKVLEAVASVSRSTKAG